MANEQVENGQPVQIVDANVLDEMNETNSLIAERASEIYESRGGHEPLGRQEEFSAEGEVSRETDIDFDVTDSAVRLTVPAPGFAAKDLEVIIGHRRAVICGLHPDSNRPDGRAGEKKILRIVELPFDVDPVPARATFQNGKLQVILPRLDAIDSPLGKAAGL